MTRLIGFICKEHGYVNVENSGGLCPKCKSTPTKRNNTNGTTYFETALGREINTKDIDRIGKENGWVYGGDDLSVEAKKNKTYTQERCYNEFKSGLNEQLRNVL